MDIQNDPNSPNFSAQPNRKPKRPKRADADQII